MQDSKVKIDSVIFLAIRKLVEIPVVTEKLDSFLDTQLRKVRALLDARDSITQYDSDISILDKLIG